MITDQTIQLNQQVNHQGRLDKVLAGLLPGVSRTQVKDLIQAGKVQVNVEVQKAKFQLQGDECLSIQSPDQETVEDIAVLAEDLPLDIVYEDDCLLVINKPAGMVVHPSKGHPRGTLVNGLLYYLNGQLAQGSAAYRPGIVHRIDKDTSGLLVVAKTDQAHQALSQQLGDHSLARTYLAVVHGQVKESEGEIHLPLKRDPKNRLRWHVDAQGKEAWTDFRVLAVGEYYSLLSLKLHTGRTHQIRVHLEAIGHPIIGDPVYRRGLEGQKGPYVHWTDGQYLHAYQLRFRHPVSQEWMTFTCPIPARMQAMIDSLPVKRGDLYV